jgi:hypothetical protein
MDRQRLIQHDTRTMNVKKFIRPAKVTRLSSLGGPSLPMLHQLLIYKLERFGADTYLSAEWIVHGG